MVRMVTPQGRRSSVRPFWQGTSPAGRTYNTARLGGWSNDAQVDDAVWLYGGTTDVGYSLGAFLFAPGDADHDSAILVRTTRIGVPSADGVDLAYTRFVMDALSPEGHSLGVVQAAGPRACWNALVPAIDAYFDSLT